MLNICKKLITLKRRQQMQKQLFVTTKDKFGYTEEHIIIKRENQEGDELLNYSLSNNLEDIKIAVYARTGHDIDLDKAYWQLNPNLSISTKHLMNKHQVNFSMTILDKGEIVVNMRFGDKWFSTRFVELKGSYYSWYQFDTTKKILKILKEIADDSDDEE
jgi:hypothetical protein